MSSRRRSKGSRPLKPTPKSKLLPSALIIAGLILIVITMLLVKNRAEPVSVSGLLPEEQLNSALQSNTPAFVFLHSTDCIPCKEMMGIVDAVYPEFTESVALVDVNIYDSRNQALMRSEGLQVIPTLVFYDSKGTRQTHMGVMEPAQFRTTLLAMAPGN